MTRNFIRLLFLAFCCTAAFAAEVAIASNALSSASIANLGFENGGAHWRVPRPTWRVEDGAGRKGSKGLVWENSNPDVYSFPAQCVTLEGGGIYRFGCWVKVDSLQKDGKKIRPSVSLDWSDASGKWMSAAYAHPVVGNETDTDGWVRFEGVTSPLPAEATQGNLLCFLPKGATGKVRFDDFSFKPEAVRMVDWLCSSAYRDTATGGNVSFHASLYLNLVKYPLNSIEPCFSYTAADGRAVLAAPDKMSPQSASITIPVSAMAKGRQMVAFVLRDKQSGMGLGYAECAFTRADAFSRRVMFDEHKRTLVDGRPFLPLGMYASRIDADILAKYTNGVFNCIMLYSATRDQLDVAQAAGLKVIYSVKDMVWGGSHVRKGCETREKSLAAIRAIVESAKKHPALLAWYVNDESPESQIAALREVNAMIHELDPDHPTWAVTDKPWHARPFLGTYDCLGMDPYPIGNNRGGIDIAAGWALEARRGFFDTVPMWHVPQAFNWKWYRRTSQNPEHRFPTRQELDSMFWQAIAAGANGLVPYAFHSMCKFMDEAEFDKAMADVVAVMSAVKRRESVILSDPGPSAVTDAKNLFCRTWTSKTGERWLLLSNANRERISSTVTLGEKFANAQSEDGVAAALTAPNTLSVKLDPLASGFVRLAPQNLATRTEELVANAIRDIPYDSSIGRFGLGDLYLPEKVTPETPVVLTIHGGGWGAGDRYSWSGVAEFFCRNLGFAAFNIEYRLASASNRWPACGDDCVKAANWLFSDGFRERAGFTPRKIYICGGSAGGHLTLWTLVNMPPEKIAGAVSISSIGDPEAAYHALKRSYRSLFGEKVGETAFAAMNPILKIKPGMAPVLCTHVTEDKVVPIASHKAFADAYSAVGNVCEFFEYPTAVRKGLTGHCIWIPGSKPHRLIPEIETKIAAFMRKQKKEG